MMSSAESRRLSLKPVLRLRIVPIAVGILLVATYVLTASNFTTAGIEEAGFFGGDFIQEWTGGYLIRTGEAHRLYDQSYIWELQHDPAFTDTTVPDEKYLPTVYPPFYYVLVSPLSLLPFRTAAWLWAILMFGCFGASVLLFGSWAGRYMHGGSENVRSSSIPMSVWWGAVVGLLFLPLMFNFISGQKGTVLLLLFTLVLWLLQRERSTLAGAAFGLLAIKPQLLPVLALTMLLKRRWRFVGGMVGSVLFLVVLALIVVGVEPLRQFAGFVPKAGTFPESGGYPLARAHSLYGFSVLLTGGVTGLLPLLLTAIGALTVGALLTAMLRPAFRAGSISFPLQYAALVVATVLISPHLLTYDLTVLLLPFGCIVAYVVRRRYGVEESRHLLWPVVFLWALAGASPFVARATGFQMSTLLLLVLLGALAFETARRPAGKPEAETVG